MPSIPSFPWSGTAVGSAGPYTNAQFAAFQQGLYNRGGNPKDSGVMRYSNPGTAPTGMLIGDGLDVTQQGSPNMTVNVAAGAAVANGVWVQNTSATNTLTVTANASGNPRIDTVVIHIDGTLQTAVLQINAGTPAATPAPPALTQSASPTGIWEIPIADIAVANGALSITQANITPRQIWGNQSDGVYIPVFNNSGATLTTGLVVVWDTTVTQGVKLSTTLNDPAVAGVVVGRIPIGGTGIILVRGTGWVYTSATVAIGNVLSQSTTSGQAVPYANTLVNAGQFAYALAAFTGAGLVQAFIDCTRPAQLLHAFNLNGKQSPAFIKYSSSNYTTSSATFVDMDATNLIFTATLNTGRVLLLATLISNNSSSVQNYFDFILDSTTRAGGANGVAGTINGTNSTNVTVIGQFTGLTQGSHTFKLQWRASATTGTVTNGTFAPLVFFMMEY